MKTLRFVFGDQLTREISSLKGLDPARDIVLMAEVADETTYVRHHKQKIVFILSAMRHFAAALRAEGVTVDYIALDDPANTGSFSGELSRAVARHAPGRVVITEPGEWRVRQMIDVWTANLGVPVQMLEDDRYFCSLGQFAAWAEGRKQLRMEFFYREMRRRTGILMQGETPAGGEWNYDSENRKKLPASYQPPLRKRFPPDDITNGVIGMVAARFADHFGDLDAFGWPVTRADALKALDHFIDAALPNFGDYQDAMKQGAPFLHHALLSPALNAGLLNPREICAAAEAAWAEGRAPLNAVEGFIRQILGWREYVRGLYWLKMPGYAETNALKAARPLPRFYWSGDTQMNCLKQCVSETRAHAYAHHIQRLMVLGNFALIAGIAPAELEDWFLAVYADAYEWVELPNVHGMVLWADGGYLASKPYAASGAYIDRMSDYCCACAYDVKAKAGEAACPFNYLYWDFIARNADTLRGNPRMAMPYRTLEKMTPARRDEIAADSARFLEGLT